jgi:hypothetical protein
MQVMALAVIVLSALLSSPSLAPGQQPIDRERALTSFRHRIESYMALHQRIEGPIPPPAESLDRRSTLGRRYLQSAIRSARAGARQGDIFSPEVAQLFRALIAESLADRDVEAMLTEMNADHPWEHGTHALVNESCAPESTHEVPRIVLVRLPAVSPHLQYRILDHDLVLVDVHADLVIDYVPNAFGRSPATTAEKPSTLVRQFASR